MEPSQKVLQNRNYLIAGIVVVLAIGYFVVQKQEAKAPQTSEDQVSGENTNSAQTGGETNQNTNSSSGSNSQPAASSEIPTENAGNIEATGTVQVSDIPSRGNFMLDSSRGKIYVKTSRDFSDLVGKQANLAAEGNINSFVFLGFIPGAVNGNVAGAATTDISDAGGGDTLPTTAVSLSGTLSASDDQTKGNYLINSPSGKIYFKSQHDYTAWQSSAVELTATGTINSFTGAVLNKK